MRHHLLCMAEIAHHCCCLAQQLDVLRGGLTDDVHALGELVSLGCDGITEPHGAEFGKFGFVLFRLFQRALKQFQAARPGSS